jgi:hypothetical protein
MLYGMQGMSSDVPEVRSVLSDFQIVSWSRYEGGSEQWT